MHILATAFLALIGAFFAAGTAIAGNSSNMQFFPPVAYGTACSQGAPVSAWNGAGSGKGTYCIELPICATGQFLTTVADTNGNPSFICVDPSTDLTAADATATGSNSAGGASSSSQTSTSTSGTDSSSSTSAGTETPPIILSLGVENGPVSLPNGQFYPSFAYVGTSNGPVIAIIYPPYPPTFPTGPDGSTPEFYVTDDLTFYAMNYGGQSGGTGGKQCFISVAGGVVSCVPAGGPGP